MQHRDSPLDHSAQPESLLALMRGLQTLSAEQQAVFVLMDLQGADTAAVAQALALSPEAVRARLSRARKHVRAALQEG